MVLITFGLNGPQRRREALRRDLELDIRVLIDQPECQCRIRRL